MGDTMTFNGRLQVNTSNVEAVLGWKLSKSRRNRILKWRFRVKGI